MSTNPKKLKKVKSTLALTEEAQAIMLDSYASVRTQGDFISELIVAHHARQTRKLTPTEIIRELARLVDLLARSAVNIGTDTEHSPILIKAAPHTVVDTSLDT